MGLAFNIAFFGLVVSVLFAFQWAGHESYNNGLRRGYEMGVDDAAGKVVGPRD